MNDIVYIKPEQFGNNLANIPAPPKKLYAKGETSLLFKGPSNKNASGTQPNQVPSYICIIGARKHSAYGLYITREIIKFLKDYNVVIVSGLATGIDSITLETALSYKIPTIAVVGSGLDESVLYPQDNIPLARKMLSNGGLLLSEYEPLFKAQKWTFPMRNRIMAGISDHIIVVEGTRKSGTLITAKLGLEFGRNIIAVPGPITSDLSQGPLALIESGATPLVYPEQILKLIGLQSDTDPILHDKPTESELYKRLSPHEQTIIQKLSRGPLTKEELFTETEISIRDMQIALTLLEIKNLIIERHGKIIRL